MKTLDLNDAAELLMMHPSTLQSRAKSGEIPGAKPGKCWVFIDVDLMDWLRSQYTINRQDMSREKEKCSLKETKRGITNSASRDQSYINLLAPATKKKPEPLKQKPILTH